MFLNEELLKAVTLGRAEAIARRRQEVAEALLLEETTAHYGTTRKSTARRLGKRRPFNPQHDQSSDGVNDVSNAYRHDIFLCHAYLDKRYIIALNRYLETALGLDVFVDWIEMPELSRANITEKTGDKLRERMDQSRVLIYAFSMNTSRSRWTPWELGYFHGRHGGGVAVLPIASSDRVRHRLRNKYSGQEYLGMYPRVTVSKTGPDQFSHPMVRGVKLATWAKRCGRR